MIFYRWPSVSHPLMRQGVIEETLFRMTWVCCGSFSENFKLGLTESACVSGGAIAACFKRDAACSACFSARTLPPNGCLIPKPEHPNENQENLLVCAKCDRNEDAQNDNSKTLEDRK